MIIVLVCTAETHCLRPWLVSCCSNKTCRPLVFQDEDMRDARFNFAGYNMSQCVPTKDGSAVKNAVPAPNPQTTTPKDVDATRKKFVDRAKRIDTISRAAFPLAFLIFNVFYWITYKIIRHEDIHKNWWHYPLKPRISQTENCSETVNGEASRCQWWFSFRDNTERSYIIL